MEIQNLLNEWEKYLTGSIAHEPGQYLPNYSVMSTIQSMVNDDFIFRTFNAAGLEMSKNREKYEDLFCSNRYLNRALTHWYYTTQLLYVRRLTDNSTRRDDWKKTCSLMNLLTNIEKTSGYIDREKFRGIREWNVDPDIRFDVLSEKDENSRSDVDIISSDYIAKLKNKLKIKEIETIRRYTDKVLAHSDFESFNDPFGMETIQKCHHAIIEVYREIELYFFGRGESDFGKTNLWEELVMEKSNQPFFV
jgi:hypothetical protein